MREKERSAQEITEIEWKEEINNDIIKSVTSSSVQRVVNMSEQFLLQPIVTCINMKTT